MCLAIPGKLTHVNLDIDSAFRTGTVSFDGITREVNLSMVPQARENDYVLVHVGVALNVVDEDEANKIREVLQQAGEWAQELDDPENLNGRPS